MELSPLTPHSQDKDETFRYAGIGNDNKTECYDSQTGGESNSVSTAPRSPLPKIGTSLSLHRERDALRLRAHRKDTECAVERMRKKLKQIGILASTKKKTFNQVRDRLVQVDEVDSNSTSNLVVFVHGLSRSCEGSPHHFFELE